MIFGGSRSDFGTLTLYDGATINFDPTLLDVTVTCDRLVLLGKATIDLIRHIARLRPPANREHPIKPPQMVEILKAERPEPLVEQVH
jgi:hypothetical protein